MSKLATITYTFPVQDDQPLSPQEIRENEILDKLSKGRAIYTLARNEENRAHQNGNREDYRFWYAIKVAAGREQIVLMKNLEKIRSCPTCPP